MSKVMKSDAIRNLLGAIAPPDLSELYHLGMEVQVNVSQDEGEPITGNYRGKQWQGWSDGITTWKPFRIPYKANSEPEYEDRPISFDLERHAEGIGMTGWNWMDRQSMWVAYDFDAILGHADAHQKKLTDDEMKRVLQKAEEIPWVTIRKSTSGNGLHLYVFLEGVQTDNHNEHAALARAILNMMTGLTGYNFATKVDICGGNMWVWHRKMRGTQGLTLVKQGEILSNSQIPLNWRDHLKVISGRHSKTVPRQVAVSGNADTFNMLSARKLSVKLDNDHLSHIEWLKDNNCVWWWDSDQHMLVTHTAHLKEMHRALHLTGLFDTITSHSSPQNCFMFPLRNGAWAVRRYSLGVNEALTWEQDGDGWTRCYLNKFPTIESSCAAHGGIEDTNGEFTFKEAEVAAQAAAHLGVEVKYDSAYLRRPATLKKHKDGRLIMTIKKEADDVFSEQMKGWMPKKDKCYQRIFSLRQQEMSEPEAFSHDELVRHTVTEAGTDSGWLLSIGGEWTEEPLAHIRLALQSHGMSAGEVTQGLGSAILNCWRLVNRPFQPEYPGDRVWNRDGAKLAFVPSDYTQELHYPTWTKIFDHLGERLTKSVLENAWCEANCIKTGGEYLMCWVASLFQQPERHLPYLFFYSGEQNTGKTSFYEALFLLVTKGYIKANEALRSQGNFSGELANSIICAVEEEDMGGQKSRGVYDRIKDWVTAREILIHPKGGTPYLGANHTHWIQCSNDHKYCPIFPGDTRITMISVGSISPLDMIPAGEFDIRLKREAPDFLAEILNIEIPPHDGRLRIPALESAEKEFVQAVNKTELETFLSEACEPCAGHSITFKEVHAKFTIWLSENDLPNWSKIKMGRALPPEFPKGRKSNDSNHYIGNLKWKTDTVTQPNARMRFFLEGEYLRTAAIAEKLAEAADDSGNI